MRLLLVSLFLACFSSASASNATSNKNTTQHYWCSEFGHCALAVGDALCPVVLASEFLPRDVERCRRQSDCDEQELCCPSVRGFSYCRAPCNMGVPHLWTNGILAQAIRENLSRDNCMERILITMMPWPRPTQKPTEKSHTTATLRPRHDPAQEKRGFL